MSGKDLQRHQPPCWLRVLWLCAASLAFPQLSLATVYSEQAVKAAFLYRFAAYVEWPATTPTDAPFTIAIVDADDVAAQLQQLLAGHNIRGRPAQVVRIHRSEELRDVQILYLGPAAAAKESALLTAAISQPILIVTDEEDGLRLGGIINFLPVGTNVRFEVSLSAATRSQLKIDAGLLSVAARVEGRPGASLLGPGGAADPTSAFACHVRLGSELFAQRVTWPNSQPPLPPHPAPRCSSCS